jgi:hypothetical protein
MRWAVHAECMGANMNAYRFFVVKSEGKKPIGKLRRRWEDSVKMDLREIGWGGTDWIDVAQDKHQWRRPIANIVINFRVLWQFLRNYTTGGFSRRS